MSANESASANRKPMQPAMRALLGLLLLLPACALCSVDQLLLTVSTFISSLREFSPSGSADFVGFENYASLFANRGFPESFGFTILLVFIHVLLTAIPVLLALAVNGFGKRSRLVAILLFTLPLAYFGPALVMFGPAYARDMWRTDSPEQIYLLLDTAAGLAVACGVGMILYPAILRGREETEVGWKPVVAPLIITWLVVELATTAYVLQSFNLLSGLLPNFGSVPLTYLLFQTFRNFQGGLTSALSNIIFILAALCGIAATVALLLGRLQLSYEARTETSQPPMRRAFSILGWVALLIGGVAVLLVTITPLLLSIVRTLAGLIGGSARLYDVSILRVWVNSILPPLLVILLIQLPIAYLGAVGISIVRPFGKGSQWLLLLFSPWLFVTSLPLAFAAFQNLRTVELLDSPVALIPPLLLSVPMLFILTLFFSGRESKWREARAEGMPAARAFFKQLIVPSLPLAVFMGAISLVASTQDLFMPLLTGFDPDLLTASSAILKLSAGMTPSTSTMVVTLFGCPFVLILLVLLAVLRFLHLERLVITRSTAQAMPVISDSGGQTTMVEKG